MICTMVVAAITVVMMTVMVATSVRIILKRSFCQCLGSGIGRSGQNLAELAAGGRWLDGRRFGGGVSEDELKAWIDSLK